MPLPVKSFETDAPMSAAEASQYTVGVADYMHGRPGELRASLPGYDSVILTLFILALLLVSVNARQARTALGHLGRELWSVRRRPNAFDDNALSGTDTGVVLSMMLLTCVCEGALLFSWFHRTGADMGAMLPPWAPSIFMLMPLAALCALVYYFLQVMAYDIVGYTFTDKIGRVQWLRGFNASQSLLAPALLAPALTGLFYPAWAAVSCLVGAAFYVLARIVFIIKGFRIFCTGFTSFLYFILYLCTLEIAPLALMVRLTGVAPL